MVACRIAGTLEDLLPAGDEYLFGNATAVNANGTAGAFGGAHSNAGLTPPAEAGQKYDQPYDQYDQPYDPQDDMQYEQADGHVAGPDAETPSAGAAAAADGPDALVCTLLAGFMSIIPAVALAAVVCKVV